MPAAMINIDMYRARLMLPALAILLASSMLHGATTLYKWVEADGSITFSPTPPPAGVAYEQVGSALDPESSLETPSLGASVPSEDDSIKIDSREELADVSPVGVTPSTNDAAATAARASDLGIRATEPAKVSVETPARLSYAPSGNSAGPDSGLSALTTAQEQVSTSAMDSRPPLAAQPQSMSRESLSPDAVAQRNKRARCEQLKMRVVSLERRLRQRLSPGDMDNTVVHMARYQSSYDRHCQF